VAAQAVLIVVGAIVIAVAALWGGGQKLRVARASA
jgi:hypothetical protein